MRVIILDKNGNKKTVNLNRRKAIRELCLNCSAWSRKEVDDCSFKDCPLYPFRLGVGKQDPKARNEAIKKYCLFCMAGKRSEVGKCASVNCPLYPYRKAGVSRTTEIDSMVKSEHIETLSKAKTDNEYNTSTP